MLKYIRIFLVAAFVLALLGAGGLYLYNYTHEDVAPPAFDSDTDLLEVSVSATDRQLCAGLRAYDNVDGDITDRIMVKSISQLINDTDVRVTYIVFDDASNYATYERTVRYADYVPPHFSLSKGMSYNAGDTVTFLDRLSARDAVDGDITSKLTLLHSSVVSNIPGTYSVTVSVTNSLGDSSTLPLTVIVVNRTPSLPQINLSEYLIYLPKGSPIRPRDYLAGVEDPLAEDEINLREVRINGKTINTDVPGVYEAYYYYTGESGEIATAILTVVVE
jgi:hypothetical protein